MAQKVGSSEILCSSSGATLVEYALVVLLVAVACIGVIADSVGATTREHYVRAGQALE